MENPEISRIKQRYDIIGRCEALDRAIEIALKIAPIDLSVLVMGENGSGKDVFARIIHDAGARRRKKFIAINCGAIPEGTIDSELFGHEKGSFTGAVEKRDGYFAAANGGTLFLDEVGELPLQTQARLLRVLETGEYISVGSSEVRKTDVRIVAATNVNLEEAVEQGRFRQDLYYRLNTVSIKVPALRERGEDILLLFRKFALDMSERYQMPPVRLSPEASDALLAYSWPGNVRQLRNLAESISVTSDERVISRELLANYLPLEAPRNGLAVVGSPKGEHSFENEREILYRVLFDLRKDVTELKKIVAEWGVPYNNKESIETVRAALAAPYAEAEEIKEETTVSSLQEVEKDYIARILHETHGSRRLAAERLGIPERTLYRKLREYGLEDVQ